MTKLKKFDSGNVPIMANSIEKNIQRMRDANEVRTQKKLIHQRGHYPEHHEPSLKFSVEGAKKRIQNEKLQPGTSHHIKWLSKTGNTGKSGAYNKRVSGDCNSSH